jgi:hypothetical protein
MNTLTFIEDSVGDLLKLASKAKIPRIHFRKRFW